MGTVAGVISGKGVYEAQWRASAWLASLPVSASADLMQGASRLLVVSPHPDDEVLGCGGLIQAALAARLPVTVVSVTDGEACYPDQLQWPCERLRRVRRGELQLALARLGGPVAVTVLALADGGVTQAHDRLQQHLHGLLQPDDLVLAPWEHDGHPDHEACGRAARKAADGCGARLLEYPVWAWHWLWPEAAEAPWSCARRVPMSLQARERKRHAVAAYASQTGTAGGLTCAPILPAHVLERFDRDFEVVIG